MKNLISIIKLNLITVIFLIAGSMQAQMQNSGATSPEAMASEQTKYLAKQLQLEGKQVKDLEEINLMYAQQVIELRKKGTDDNSKNDIEALKRSHSNKMRSLLSSEKYRKYLALKSKEEDSIQSKSNR